MTRRESRAIKGAQLFFINVAVACSITLAACDDGLEPGQQKPASSNTDGGGQRDGSTSTSSNPSTARDGGGDGARPMGGSASGGSAMGGDASGAAAMGGAAGGGAAGGGTGGGGTGGADSGMQSPSVQVAPACMGHGGETVCDGANLIRCGMAGNAEATTPCMNEARCRAGLMTGKCGNCDPGAAHCKGAELQECNANGEFVMKMACPSAELCSEMNKSCNPMQCGADTVKCESGSLKRCKADLTGFDMGMPCMSQMLCSEPDKRCNECMPNSKVCEGDNVMTCSADGKGPTPMQCSGTTPRCLGGKCVQCKEDTDCMTTQPCRVPKCNKAMGMCAPEVAAARTMCTNGSTSGVCDLLGACVQCLDDSNCPASQRCSLLSTCVARAPLTVSSLLGCSITLNAGFSLYPTSINETSGDVHITASLTEFLFPSATIDRVTQNGSGTTVPALVRADTAARTFRVSATYTAPMNMSGTATCTAQQSSESTATFSFSGGGATLTATLVAR